MPHQSSSGDLRGVIDLAQIRRAILILNDAHGKRFCSAVLFIADAAIIVMTTELDCSEGCDYFALTTRRYELSQQGHIIAAFGDAATTLEVSSPVSLAVSLDGFRGNQLQNFSVGGFTISGRDNQSYTFRPDRDRWIADQMMLMERV